MTFGYCALVPSRRDRERPARLSTPLAARCACGVTLTAWTPEKLAQAGTQHALVCPARRRPIPRPPAGATTISRASPCQNPTSSANAPGVSPTATL